MSGSSEDIARAERSADMLRRRREGASFATLADEFGVSRQHCHRIVTEALKAIPAREVDEYRTQELERLEYLRERTQQVLDRRHYLAYQGLITDVEDDGPALDAIKTDVRISESIRKLVGADAPVRTEAAVTASVRFEIVGVDLGQLG